MPSKAPPPAPKAPNEGCFGLTFMVMLFMVGLIVALCAA